MYMHMYIYIYIFIYLFMRASSRCPPWFTHTHTPYRGFSLGVPFRMDFQSTYSFLYKGSPLIHTRSLATARAPKPASRRLIYIYIYIYRERERYNVL